MLIKILLLCVCAVLITSLMPPKAGVFSSIIRLCCLCLAALLAVNAVAARLAGFFESMTLIAECGELIGVLIKAAVITVSAQLAADYCRDSGSASLASAAELAARALIVALSLPFIQTVLKTALDFLD